MTTRQNIAEPVTTRRDTPEPPRSSLAIVERVNQDMRRRLDAMDLPGNLADAIAYSLLEGGKRIRPVLLLLSCKAVGGEIEPALPAAMAIELIHAFSLVHDDLPAMDDDDLRRGRPTLHIARGEAMAILAGDAMLSLAFEVLADPAISQATAGRLTRELARGATSMIAGQVYDTLGDQGSDDEALERLLRIHRNKTGALLIAACRMGGICQGADEAALDALTRFGEAVGLMFQIVDDLLDVEQTAEHTGKRTNKDEQAGKLTFPAVLGVEASKGEVRRRRDEAIASLERFGPAAEPLRDLCEYLAIRTR